MNGLPSKNIMHLISNFICGWLLTLFVVFHVYLVRFKKSVVSENVTRVGACYQRFIYYCLPRTNVGRLRLEYLILKPSRKARCQKFSARLIVVNSNSSLVATIGLEKVFKSDVVVIDQSLLFKFFIMRYVSALLIQKPTMFFIERFGVVDNCHSFSSFVWICYKYLVTLFLSGHSTLTKPRLQFALDRNSLQFTQKHFGISLLRWW